MPSATYVRVHTEAKSAESSRAVNAVVYSVGLSPIINLKHPTNPSLKKALKVITDNCRNVIGRSFRCLGCSVSLFTQLR
jgi:hypothetical protein